MRLVGDGSTFLGVDLPPRLSRPLRASHRSDLGFATRYRCQRSGTPFSASLQASRAQLDTEKARQELYDR